MSNTHPVEEPPRLDGHSRDGHSRADGDEDATSPTVRIRSLLPGLARAEQRVAHVVLDNTFAVAQRSITEVARAANTSETTVTRFCKAIGVTGYPALRIALAADTARPNGTPDEAPGGDITAADDIATLLNKISRADIHAIADTAQQLDTAALEKAVASIATANRVDIYGIGASAPIATELQQKLHRIGRVASAWSDAHMMLTSAAALGPRDVALAVSHTGATTDTVAALRAAANQGATTIAITNFACAPISQVAGHVLTTAAGEATLRFGDTASHTATLTVIDCLFAGVAQREMATSVRTLGEASQQLHRHRLPARQDGRRRDPPQTG